MPPISLPSLLSSPSSEGEKEEEEDEDVDIFSSALPFLYPTVAHNQHGYSGSSLLYAAPPPRPPIRLRLSDPPRDQDRRLFAHYVWNAGVLLAEALGRGTWFRALDDGQGEGKGKRLRAEDWNVDGKDVLELGAGTALVSLVAAAHTAASSVTITDYPAAYLLDSIRRSADENLGPDRRSATSVRGHLWGNLDGNNNDGNDDDDESDLPRSRAHAFHRIVAADTLWLASQHLPLARSMAHFLSPDEGSRVWIAAGFHTGRAKVAAFFDEAPRAGLRVLRRWEIDVDGQERDWADYREGEDIQGASRWTMIAVLGWA